MARPNNYFAYMIDRYNGDRDFIPKLRPDQIQKSAKDRIFREMVMGNIDYTIYGEYFLDSKFLENLIIAAQDELTNKSTIATALYFYDVHYPGNQAVAINMDQHANLAHIYSTILNKLQTLKFTGDIGILIDTQILLRDFRQYILR